MTTTETAELLARECAKRLSPSVSTYASMRVISECIPLIELLNVASASQGFLITGASLERVYLEQNLTALRAKLPK